MTRCLMGGTQTVLTRRLGRNSRGYVSTRCPRGGTRTVRPRRAQGGVGSLLTRCQMGGTQAVTTRRSRRAGERAVMTRCLRLGGDATVVDEHDNASGSLPGGCPVLQEGLATANPRQWVHIGGRRGKTTGEFTWMDRIGGRASPPGPLTGQSRTDGARCGAALAGHLSNIWRGGVRCQHQDLGDGGLAGWSGPTPWLPP